MISIPQLFQFLPILYLVQVEIRFLSVFFLKFCCPLSFKIYSIDQDEYSGGINKPGSKKVFDFTFKNNELRSIITLLRQLAAFDY